MVKYPLVFAVRMVLSQTLRVVACLASTLQFERRGNVVFTISIGGSPVDYVVVVNCSLAWHFKR